MSTQTTIRITSCSDRLLWYSEKLGQVFTSFARDDYGFWVRTGDGWNTTNFVKPEDCEEVKEAT